MKITKAAVLIWLSASLPSFGAVEAVLLHVTTNETFSVPTGKVLIIENMITSTPGGPSTLRLENGTNSFVSSSVRACASRSRFPVSGRFVVPLAPLAPAPLRMFGSLACWCRRLICLLQRNTE